MRVIGAIGLLIGGLLVASLGLGVLAVGTGVTGSETFTRIDCHEVRVDKGGTARHCFGESPVQIAANDRPLDPFALDRPFEKRQRTRLTFAEDRDVVTATRVGHRWIAHSPSVRSTGVFLFLAGGGVTAAGWVAARAAGRTQRPG